MKNVENIENLFVGIYLTEKNDPTQGLCTRMNHGDQFRTNWIAELTTEKKIIIDRRKKNLC